MADIPNETQNALSGDDKEPASNDWGSTPDQSGWMSNSTSNWNDTDAAQDTSGWEMPSSTTDWGGQQSSTGGGWEIEDDSMGDGPIIRNGMLIEAGGDTKKRKDGGGRGKGRGRGRGGGYVPETPAQRERMEDRVLEERMAKMRAQNNKIRERREQIKADEEAFHALMAEERDKQARSREQQAQIDQTREQNAKRKMDKIDRREWDVAKQDGNWKKRAWDVGKKDGDQQREGENSEQPGKGFPLSRIEERKLEIEKSGVKPKSKTKKEKKKADEGDEDWGSTNSKVAGDQNANIGDTEDWGAANANLDDGGWGSGNVNDEPFEAWGTSETWNNNVEN